MSIADRQTFRWAPEGEVLASLESTRRLDLPPEIVAGISEIGNAMDPENMARIQELLAALPLVYQAREIEIVELIRAVIERHD